jgi:inhibitor of cysteine peptidase
VADIDLTAADDGRVRAAKPGDTLVVHLDESPTSGYRWSVERLDDRVLTPAGDDFAPAGGAAPGGGDAGPAGGVRLGGGGTRVLRFTVAGPGRGELVLRRWRSWEGDGSVVERFATTVDATSRPA